MSTDPLTNALQHRPGGRTADVTRRIHDVVLDLILSGGADRCTFQTVARRAKVERSTLYRRYPNRWAMMGDAFAAAYVDDLAFEPTGSFRGDLTCHLSRVAHTLGSAMGMAMLAAAAVARLDTASPDAAGAFWEFRKERQRPFVQLAIDRGELPANVSLEALFAAADGPLYFRLIVIGAPIDQAWIEDTVDQVCKAFCLPARQTASGLPETPS